MKSRMEFLTVFMPQRYGKEKGIKNPVLLQSSSWRYQNKGNRMSGLSVSDRA